jgi:dipeptidyl aminopeptidase/acylaminoacyl peptidase
MGGGPISHGQSARRLSHGAAVAFGLTAALTAPGLGAASLEGYARLPHIEAASLSPDGTRVAFVRPDGNTRIVAVIELAHGGVVRQLRGGDEKLRSVRWVDNNHLLIENSVTTLPADIVGLVGVRVLEPFQAQVYDIKANNLFVVPHPNGLGDLGLMNIIAGEVEIRHANDRTQLFIPGVQELFPRADTGPAIGRALLRVDLGTHSSRLIAAARAGNVGWIVDPAGEVVVEETYDTKSSRWSILTRREGGMQEATSGEGGFEFPRLVGLGPTPDSVLLQQLEGAEPVWRALSLKDGSLSAPVAEHRTLDRPIEDPETHRVIGGVREGDREEYVFFDPEREKAWQTVLHAFHDERLRLESASSDFRKIIVRVEGERDGYCFELVDLNTHHADPIGEVYPGIHHRYEVRRITYPAADGLQIPAYLTLPGGKPPENLPLIVLPHAGPAARDTADFEWWSQALADQGYVVLRPNYRGSDLTRTLLTRGFGEWGRKMQTDLSDGVRYLVKEGIADPARVCIVGGGYGGYAALAAVSLDSGAYRCAVAVAGIFDIRRMLEWMNKQQLSTGINLAQRYWDRFMGVSGPNDPAVDAISPIKHVGAVKVPVLLIHGRDDAVVPFEQSAEMYDALHAAHKEVKLVVLPNEDHWLSRSETRLQMLQSSVEFLRAHNPPE